MKVERVVKLLVTLTTQSLKTMCHLIYSVLSLTGHRCIVPSRVFWSLRKKCL